MSSMYDLYIEGIHNELSNRKFQLSKLPFILNSIDNNDFYSKLYFMQVSVPELYAKYEGFFKFIFKHTIDYLSNENLDNHQLYINFLILPLITKIDSNTTNQKTKTIKTIKMFDDLFNQNKSYFELIDLEEYILNLDSTMHSLNLLNIGTCGIPMGSLDSLYNRRNEIAHGSMSEHNPFNFKFDSISSDSVEIMEGFWTEHYNTVIRALDVLSDLFIDYISNKKYLRINSPQYSTESESN